MAKVKIKGKKVTGTKKKDKIVSTGKGVWKKALTVNAGAGNDLINFKKSKANKNKLYGQAGNDIIYGGKKVDYIYGGDGNDKLYGYNGNDVIYAGNGNDFIDGGNGNDKIWGDSGNNTLKGGVGNDIITGGTGNDSIYGNKGNDQINAGKGNNTIYFNKGDGKDTVLNGDGVDTLVFAKETPETLTAEFSGGDLVLTGKNGGNTVILKGYWNGDHSAQWITIGNKTVRTDTLLTPNVITEMVPGSPNIYNGTNQPDDIQVNVGSTGYTEYAVVNAYAGDDTITLNNAVYFTVNPGKGNDVIQTTGQTAFGTIKIDKNGGNDTFIGIENANWRYQAVLDASTTTNGKFDNSLLVRKVGNVEYILGERQIDDLIIKLTDGNTFTVKNYFTQNSHGYNWENMAFVSEPDDTSSLNSYLELSEPKTVTLNKNNNTLNKETDNSRYIVDASENANYTVKLGDGNQSNIYFDKRGNHTVKLGNGDSNNVVINKDGSHNVTVGNGNYNNIELGFYPHVSAVMDGSDLPPTPISGNQTVKVGDGSRNIISIATNNNSNVTIGNGYSNSIDIDNAKESTVTTGNGSGNYIQSFATDKNTITTGTGANTIYIGYNDSTKVSNDTIHSYGHDYIREFSGNTQITFEGDDSNKEKTILAKVYVGSNASKIQAIVNNVTNAQTVNLTVAPKVGALMPYYSLYDDNNDGIYDVVYSAIDMRNGKDGDREIVVKDAFNHGSYAASMTAPTAAKLCDMGRAGINSFDYTDSSIYSDCTVVVDSNGDDTITAAGNKIVSLNSGTNTLTVNNVGDDAGIVFVNGGENTINNNGKASIKIYGGDNTINLSGENIDKKIYMASSATATVNGVFNLGSDGVTSFDFGTKHCEDVMIYRAADSKDLNLVTRHFDSVATLKDIMESTSSTAILGDHLLNNIRVTANNGEDISERNLYNLWSYCDMTHDNIHTFTRNEYFDKDGEGMDTSFFVDGTTGNDEYYGISVTDNYGGHNIINDFRGDYDYIKLGSNANQDQYSNFNTFFDVYKDANGNWQIGDELIFINDLKEFREFESGDAVYLQINDFKGNGKIEEISDYKYNGFDYDKLNTVKEQVANWLTTNNFTSAKGAIDAMCENYSSTDTRWTQLANIYQGAWTENMYGQH